ncbi:hypothetical protein ACIRS1_37130 [Kitasatospora sp. NPDC101176]|uniref:hypothetical protein n=1 Tax=Kitasatospora sp. NPDC101176 TaxID=3364099 RepID=UPI0037FCE2CA
MSRNASKLTRLALATALTAGTVLGSAALATSAHAVGSSSVGGDITRSEILARAQSWIDEQVPYSQYTSKTDSNGTYRQDCSGLVSMAWHINTAGTNDGFTTQTLPGYATKLGSLDDLRPGDAIDNISTHTVLFTGWADSGHTRANIIEEAKPGTVARATTYTRGYLVSGGYLPFRYKHAVEDGPTAPPAPVQKTMTWYLSDSASSTTATRPSFAFGNTPMVPLAGDFDGNGTDTQAAYDPTTSTFYLANSGSAAEATLTFGNPGNRPVLGRWDGTTSQIGVYMPDSGKFYLRNSDGSVNSFAFGNGGDWQPVSGDWDGNGTVTVGLYDPATSTFYLRNSNTAGPADQTITFGNPNSIPLAGDWDHNGHTNIGVYMPDNHTFYLRHDDGTVTATSYGDTGDTPIVGDWNGDGYTTQGVIHT